MRTWLLVALLAACNKRTDDDALPGKTPDVFGAVAHLTPGSPEGAIKTIPKLEPTGDREWRMTSGDTTYFVTSKFEVVDEVDITKHNAKIDLVEKAWGPGVRIDANDAIWLDDKKHLRVDAETSRDLLLRFRPYVPVKDLFSGPDVASFDGVTIVGRALSTVKKDLADKRFREKEGVLHGPVAEYGLPVFLIFARDDGQLADRDDIVGAYNVGGLDQPQTVALLKPVLAARFGPEHAGSAKDSLDYGTGPRAEIFAGTIRVSAR